VEARSAACAIAQRQSRYKRRAIIEYCFLSIDESENIEFCLVPRSGKMNYLVWKRSSNDLAARECYRYTDKSTVPTGHLAAQVYLGQGVDGGLNPRLFGEVVELV